ncbi:MAG TPA: DUF309 domain-containing protein [candidate division Zixibacteria bacterium]|jgi:hypothetical protein
MMTAHAKSRIPDRTVEGRAMFDAGLREFNAGRYFEAHDIWEDFWHQLNGPDRRFLQGLIQLAVGAYHHEMDNPAGARSLWGRSIAKLEEYPEEHWGIDRGAWVEWIKGYLSSWDGAPHPEQLSFNEQHFPSYLPLAPD